MIECSELSAGWCPIHGDCICRNPEESLSDEDCPLHGIATNHGEQVIIETIWGKIELPFEG